MSNSKKKKKGGKSKSKKSRGSRKPKPENRPVASGTAGEAAAGNEQVGSGTDIVKDPE